MQLDQLRYFVAVAEEQNFRRAASRLNISQPPLSFQIKNLERELGVRLLNRTTHEVSLTEAGASFLERAKEILRLVKESADDMKARAAGRVGTLKVGVTTSTAFDPLFHHSIRVFSSENPLINVRIHEMASEKQVVALVDGKIDVGFLRWTAVPPQPEFAIDVLTHAALVLAIPDGHRLRNLDTVSLSELKNDPFVGYPESAGVGTYRQFYSLCARAGFVPKIVQEASEVSVIMGLVAAGLGVAIVPSTLRSMNIQGVMFKNIDDPESATTLDLVSRASDQSLHLRAFRKIVLDYCKSHYVAVDPLRRLP